MDIESLHLSFQDKLTLQKQLSDLEMWDMGELEDLIDFSEIEKADKGQRRKLFMQTLKTEMDRIRRAPTPYRDFTPPVITPQKSRNLFCGPETLFGRCPCPRDGELTRCCNLVTLDAVQQCSFACSYCAIQGFYTDHTIKIVKDLKERMRTIELPDDVWHLGTGQSSDSLLWGNDWDTLDALKILAARYPDRVIELKTKAARTDWITENWPENIVASWSLNAPEICKKEELLTASLSARLKAARKAADAGIPVGFHLHPMIYFEGWEEAYRAVVKKICSMFTPGEVVMVSFGTLTFTKSVLKTLRDGKRKSRILNMPLTRFAGKYSYPYEIKLKLFKNAWSAFPDSWKKDGPFFYLCFEDPALWKPVFGYEYRSNKEFEMAMKESYSKSVASFREAARDRH